MMKHHINEQDWERVSYDPRVPEGLHMTNTGDPSPQTGGLGGWDHEKPRAAVLVRHAAHDSRPDWTSTQYGGQTREAGRGHTWCGTPRTILRKLYEIRETAIGEFV